MPDAQVAVTHEDEWYAVLDGVCFATYRVLK